MKFKMNRRVCLAFLLLFCGLETFAQPFTNDIQAFKKQDSILFPPAGAILFVGSSSFTNWKDVQQYFPDKTIINRGFGGSSLPDLIRYQNDIIYPYKPKQVVVYCGENDIAASDTVTGEMVFERFRQLFGSIRNNLPGIPFVFVSLKPSPSRWQLREKMMRANQLIRKFLKKKRNAAFVDVWKQMLDENGVPVASIFLEDKLHMNASGYAIWQEKLAPLLIQ